MKEQIKMMKKLKKNEKIEKLKNDLNNKSNEEKILFKKNKRNKELNNIKNIFSKISEKLQKNSKFEEEYEKYRKDPKSFEERKMVIITKTMVDLFADDDEENDEQTKQKNNKKKMKLIKTEIEKKYEEEQSKEKVEYKPPKVKLTLDSSIKDVLCEALRYDKYIQDANYCSDYSPDDISDSDVSDIDTKEVIEEVSKTMEILNKTSQMEKAEDINQQFNEKLLNQYIKNAKEAKAFYYKEKLKIDINTPEGQESKNKMFQ